jgi:hypothetical protein
MTVDVLDPILDGKPDLEGLPSTGLCPPRGPDPDPEPVLVLADHAADQAVFDAEFVALVLAEAPWGAGQPTGAAPPPPVPPRTSRAPGPAPDLTGQRDRRARLAVAEVRLTCRRPGPGPRSPPAAHSNESAVCDQREEVTARAHADSL